MGILLNCLVLQLQPNASAWHRRTLVSTLRQGQHGGCSSAHRVSAIPEANLRTLQKPSVVTKASRLGAQHPGWHRGGSGGNGIISQNHGDFLRHRFVLKDQCQTHPEEAESYIFFRMLSPDIYEALVKKIETCGSRRTDKSHHVDP